MDELDGAPDSTCSLLRVFKNDVHNYFQLLQSYQHDPAQGDPQNLTLGAGSISVAGHPQGPESVTGFRGQGRRGDSNFKDFFDE